MCKDSNNTVARQSVSFNPEFDGGHRSARKAYAMSKILPSASRERLEARLPALVERYDAVKFGEIYQTLEGPFSSVSKPIFATKYTSFSILRDLQDLHTFAPLQTQNIRKKSSNFFRIFGRISAKILIFRQFSSNFAQILMIFFGISPNILENVEIS